jgi:PKD domain/IPT/TIG domain
MGRVRWRAGAMSHRAERGALLALLTAAMLAVGTGSASAVIVHLGSAKTLSYQPLRGASIPAQPFDAFFSNLDYNGGPVMPSNTNYTFYWDPSGAPSYPAEYQSGVNQYLEDLAHDSGGHANVDSVSAQYNDTEGAFAKYESHFAGAIIDTDPYPANGCTRAAICLTDAQLQAELTSYLTAHGLPHDLTHEYFLLTPPGVESCFEAAGRECSAGSSKPVYCAYHGNIPVSGGEIIYANDPYVTGNSGCDDGKHPTGKPSDGALEGGLSHEHNESITDPEPNNAWTDIGGSGGEVGDKCGGTMGASLGKAPDGAPYNQVINGHLYWYQEEWSNQGNECLQRLTFAGAEPTATFTSSQGSGNKVSFDATGSTAPGGVARYNWQFNDGPGLSTPTETTTPSAVHTFPEAGSYVVALTLFASDGTSIGTARTVSVGSTRAPTVSKLAPKGGPATGGTSVTLTGTGFTGATSVKFGSTSASFTVNSSSSITATSPAGAGTVDVTVTTPHGTSATSASDRFKYGAGTVTGVSPNTGPKAGGTSVTITGSGFALGSATSFLFGKASATSVNCGSSTSCTAVAPAASKSGAVDVRSVVAGKKSKKNAPADHFTNS